jgi:hypothetical protein
MLPLMGEHRVAIKNDGVEFDQLNNPGISIIKEISQSTNFKTFRTSAV